MGRKKKNVNIENMSPWQLAFRRLFGNKLVIIAVFVIVLFTLLAVFAPVISPHGRDTIDLLNRYQPPSAEHWLGTDDMGRDIFTRLIYAGRVSLSVGVLSTLIATAIGMVVGAVAGFYGGIVDMILMRIADIFSSMPFYIIAITIMALFGPSVAGTILVMGVLWWPGTAILLRGQILSLREQEFMEAATALGISDFKKIVRHLIPNAIAPIMVAATLNVANAILTESALSYLGLGIRIPIPSWGNMLTLAQNMLVLKSYWWIWVCPGFCIFITVMAFNFLGDGLRDAFDPKQDR